MVGTGRNGKYPILARVSIVNHFGKILYNKYVKPRRKVTDYRTHISGIRQKDIENGENFTTVQKEVSEMLTGKILIGHGIRHDLNVLFLDHQKGSRFYDHPKENIRDTAMYNYKSFPLELGLKKGQQPRLKDLVLKILDESIQVCMKIISSLNICYIFIFKIPSYFFRKVNIVQFKMQNPP